MNSFGATARPAYGRRMVRISTSLWFMLLWTLPNMNWAQDSKVPNETNPSDSGHPLYAFTFFRDNGQDGVYLAVSSDGLNWQEVNRGKPILSPQVGGKLTRDPSITLGGDGLYHMVWTTSWTGDGFGVAHSKDLLTWSEQQYVPINKGDSKARNTWAPEIFYDSATERYIVIWATTRQGEFLETAEGGDDGYNHRMYATSTKDFVEWEPKKLFYDGGFNVIDAFLFKAQGRYGMIVKNETLKPMAEKNLRVVWSGGGATGPWGEASVPFTDNRIAWAEGPTVLPVGDKWLIYFDEYNQGRYAAVETDDFQSFKKVDISLPVGVRHGTMLRIDAKTAERLKEKK
jgi:hypothetical protein